jgi:hypothetical protein
MQANPAESLSQTAQALLTQFLLFVSSFIFQKEIKIL